MIEGFILGAIQGIAEWLPVSSEGLTVLAYNLLFDSGNLSEAIRMSLFLHLGTFFAALIYFRKDILKLLKAFSSFSQALPETKVLLKFLVITTTISGILGVFLLKFIENVGQGGLFTGKIVTLLVGVALLITAFLQIKTKEEGKRDVKTANIKDTLFLGLAQGLASIPGISRSGITVSVLLLKKFDKEEALRLSFLMSLPIVLGGNIFLNLNNFVVSATALWGLFFSFIFGIITIDILFRVARKINFGYFILLFALLVLGSVLV